MNGMIFFPPGNWGLFLSLHFMEMINMPIEQIVIGGRASGKTTKLIEWLKEHSGLGEVILVCPSQAHGRTMMDLISGINVKLITPNMQRMTWDNLSTGPVKHIAIDELDLMPIHKLNWKNLIRHHLFITGSIDDFLFSPILRLVDIFSKQTTLLPNRFEIDELDTILQSFGKERFESQFLVSSTVPYDSFTLDEIMKKYHNPFGDD